MQIAEIIETLLAKLGYDDPPANEGRIIGDARGLTDAILVCHSASPDLLRTAAREGRRLVIARQHPFYRFSGHEGPGNAASLARESSLSWWSSGVDRLEAANDPVITAKRRLINEHDLTIYRLSSLWDAADPKRQARALAEALAMPPSAEQTPGRHIECIIAPRSVANLAREIADTLDAGPIRAMGPRTHEVKRVLLIPGYLETRDLQGILAGSQIDLLVSGEGCEWEAVPNLKDAIDMGLAPRSVIFAGFHSTEQPGTCQMAQWIARQLPGVDVRFAAAARPVRSLRASAAESS